MSLTLPPPPPQGLPIVRAAVGGLISDAATVFHALREAAPENLTVAAPQPVYVMTLKNVAAGNGLTQAVLVGWRYLVLDAERSLVAAEVNTDNPEETVEFAHVNQGPYVESTIAAINFAEGIQEVQEDDYELRLLKIPALYVVTLWLQGKSAILVPLAPCPPELNPNSAYSEEAFIDILRGPASARLLQEGNDLPEL